MASLLSLLSGGSGVWILLGGVLLSLGGGGFAGYEARGVIDKPALSSAQSDAAKAQTATQQCVATAEKGRADGDQKALDALQGGIATLNGVAADLATKEAAHQTADTNFLKELANAPTSSVCGTSAAERAYRDSVRSQSAPAAAP